ncbi:unnamed protein product [Rhizopus stolonifer]
MQYCGPNSGKKYYLRLLLTRVKGSKSFDGLKSVREVLREAFKEACVELGLTEDDNNWLFCFQETSLFATGESLLSLFVTALTEGQLINAAYLCEEIDKQVCNDLDYKLQQIFPGQIFITENNTAHQLSAFYKNSPSIDYYLYLIDKKLQVLDSNMKSYNMPEFEYSWDTLMANSEQMTNCSNTLLRAEYSYNSTSEISYMKNEDLSENSSEIRSSFSSYKVSLAQEKLLFMTLFIIIFAAREKP